MKIKELKISNIMSFGYFENVEDYTTIQFNTDLNILIGENGAGKSTALEIVNFVLKRVFFKQTNFNSDYYRRKNDLNESERKQIITLNDNRTFSDFRLNANRNTSDKKQEIKLILELDDIDKQNISNIIANTDRLKEFFVLYSNVGDIGFEANCKEIYEATIILNSKTNSFDLFIDTEDFGYKYLVYYNCFKDIINLYNLENPNNIIDPLNQTFAIIGGFRNYSAFQPSISLQGSTAIQQLNQIIKQENSKSLNSNEYAEPSIFNIVKLNIANKHYELFGNKMIDIECEREANNQLFLNKINEKLSLIHLKVGIKLMDKQNRSYSFNFFDKDRNVNLENINDLSAGQKAIIHLIFEAYGRGELKGGVVVIDEPEIHLHYQFQNEYLKILEDLNREQGCQYILVTHSEALINSKTIHNVKRFALDESRLTLIKSPVLDENQKLFVRILENTKSTHAFFSSKIILVEGETDRYFLKEFLKKYKPDSEYINSIIDILGKGNREDWVSFFKSFGLQVYFIGDFDNLKDLGILSDELYRDKKEIIKNTLSKKLSSEIKKDNSKDGRYFVGTVYDYFNSSIEKREIYEPIIKESLDYWTKRYVSCSDIIDELKQSPEDWKYINSEIEKKYDEGIFILKNGDLEYYVGLKSKGLQGIIEFCDKEMVQYISKNDILSNELKFIFDKIVG